MKIDRELSQALADVARSRSDYFVELVRLGRLDPTCDFRRADLSGADLRGEDLRAFDLTGATLNGALVHGAQFNDTVTTEQLEQANQRNHAMVLLMGHSDAKAFRAPVHQLPKDFTFDVELSKKLDDWRSERNQLAHNRPGRMRTDYAELMQEVDRAAAQTDALFILLSSASATAADLASDVLDRKLPGRRGFAVAGFEHEDRRGGPRRKFIRFKNGRVDGSWGGSIQLTEEICAFLRITRGSTPLDGFPWRKMRGPDRSQQHPSTIIAIRRSEALNLTDAIATSVTYEGWGSNLSLRLYISDAAYDRGAVIEGLKGRATGALEVYGFQGAKMGQVADAYAVLADPGSPLWPVLGNAGVTS